MNSANNETFGHSQLGALFPHLGFSTKTSIKYLQLHLFVLAIINSKIVLEELLGPTDLLGAQAFWIHEVINAIIVCENEHFILIAFQIVTLYLKSFDNS